jgi:hypothetical protein
MRGEGTEEGERWGRSREARFSLCLLVKYQDHIGALSVFFCTLRTCYFASSLHQASLCAVPRYSASLRVDTKYLGGMTVSPESAARAWLYAHRTMGPGWVGWAEMLPRSWSAGVETARFRALTECFKLKALEQVR